MLRAAQRYEEECDAIVFDNDHPYTKAFYDEAGMNPDITSELFRFCKHMFRFQLTSAEYAMLTVIVLFQPGEC